MNVLVILGHPRDDSLSGALADAYADGAISAGVALRRLALANLDFDLHVHCESPEEQALEPALRRARDDIAWADHLVLVFPTWWGTMPALLKGFLDRIVTPGFGFRFYGQSATDWQGFWSGKSAQVITTMDTPPLIYRWLYRAPGINALQKATLGFCGVRRVVTLIFGPVRTSTPGERARWLGRARRAGADLHPHSAASRRRARVDRLRAWLAALRLQFYPMSWAAYTLGALAGSGQGLALAPYAWGYLGVFCLEAATVFVNDYFDFASDRINRHAGPLTGGSRVLVQGRLSFAELRRGIALTLVLALAGLLGAWVSASASGMSLFWLPVALLLTLGYTLPPLRFSYRLLGEVDVAVTHSILVVFVGYVLQGGAGLSLPLSLGLPLAAAILPSIVLAGVPDFAADSAVGKRTVAVAFGERAAVRIAMGVLGVSAVLAVVLDATEAAGGAFDGTSYVVVPHALWCLALLRGLTRRTGELGRIDVPLAATLAYITWFVAIPFYHLV